MYEALLTFESDAAALVNHDREGSEICRGFGGVVARMLRVQDHSALHEITAAPVCYRKR